MPNIWQTKLAARIHDPAEKALVLLRDPEGHEGGTSRALTRLFSVIPDAANVQDDNIDNDNADVLAAVLFRRGISRAIYRLVQRADWWAAAADRPQWPMEQINVQNRQGQVVTLRVAPWAQVRWYRNPVLIHPLTGQNFTLAPLGQHDIETIKNRSFNHFSQLLHDIQPQAGEDPNPDPETDYRKTLLTYWRFGPELKETQDADTLGHLWRLLPADTRIPDHSIWDHLDLTSAFAGAFAADPNGEAALLALSIGPVQGFIAAARSTSDLWAGSHLLSRLAFESMKPVCEQFGPDAILFPRLRGIPQVDLWLRDEMNLPGKLFESCEWNKGGTDSNPLFSAALPNRFVAVVPASQARAIAEQVTVAVRTWLQTLGQTVVNRLLREANLVQEGEQACHQQMREQLDGFPEVHWAIVPFSLIGIGDVAHQTQLETSGLTEAMAPFFNGADGQPCGFLDTPAWQVLGQNIQWQDNTCFFAPNPGVLYPAIYDLAERVMAAAKAARPFTPSEQQGWRCSLTGETEWLTTDRNQLDRSYRTQPDTLWARINRSKPSWAKKGEHLGALPAIKRLWPTLFAEEAAKAIRGQIGRIDRFVVSTHTMALAHQMDQWLERGGLTEPGLAGLLKKYQTDSVALPRKLVLRHFEHNALNDAKRLPSLLELEADEQDGLSIAELETIQKQIGRTLSGGGENGQKARLETYYALLMMDGDRMGAILSGDEKTAIRYRDSFHPQVQNGFDNKAQAHALIHQYGQQKRAISPNRHLAISGALNDFSQTVVRHVIEDERLGRVIYAGGDDVLAMLPVVDLLPAMQRLREVYSGSAPEDAELSWEDCLANRNKLICKNGFAYLKGRLMRMMGDQATASCGAVIAHHQAPLSAVMRELRVAEKRAKTEGGRDAFSITIIKRSGGALYLTAKWGEPVTVLRELTKYLRSDDTSRRAVYHSLEWLHDLPDPNQNPEMLESLLRYQLDRQSEGDTRHMAPGLAKSLAELARQYEKGLDWLSNFMTVAEFLARETRSGGDV